MPDRPDPSALSAALSSSAIGLRISEHFRANPEVPEIGDFGVQVRAVGLRFRQSAELAIDFGEQSEGQGQHFRGVLEPLGLTGPLTLCNF